MAETESPEHDSAYGQLIIRNYCSPAPPVRDYVSQTYELDRIYLVDNVLGPAGNVA